MPQDFSHQNLRGRSFKGQDLAGADFSYADIRGADFSGANLRSANFRGTKAGLQKRWAIFLVIVSLLHEIVSERKDDFVFVDAKYVEGNYAEIYQGEANMSGERNINMGSGNYNERIQGDYVQGSKKQSNFNLQNAQFGGGLVNADTVSAGSS
jgi:uncharacterized protein YjbI with pentapeptide repeats